jgi:hypothetical protein
MHWILLRSPWIHTVEIRGPRRFILYGKCAYEPCSASEHLSQQLDYAKPACCSEPPARNLPVGSLQHQSLAVYSKPSLQRAGSRRVAPLISLITSLSPFCYAKPGGREGNTSKALHMAHWGCKPKMTATMTIVSYRIVSYGKVAMIFNDISMATTW